MKTITIINLKDNQVVGDKVEVAETTPQLMKGLLGRSGLNPGEGMLLYPCASIHCFGMKFAIDAVFLNRNKQVLALKQNMLPGSRAQARGASYVLELAAGVVRDKGIELRDELQFIENQ